VKVRLCAVNAPQPTQNVSPDEVCERALSWVNTAAADGAQFIVLPELVDALGRDPNKLDAYTHEPGDALFSRLSDLAAQHQCWLVVPVLFRDRQQLYNSAFLLDPGGKVLGRYDKTHLSLAEREVLQLTAGQTLPVFPTALGVMGIMTCFDAYFPEVARCLACQEARIIAFPSMQRGETEDFLLMQTRMRAFDSCAFVVRSCYGVPRGEQWRPGMSVGMACVVAPDATVLACTGRNEGIAIAECDISYPFPRPASYGMPSQPQRGVLFDSRRPELYHWLSHPT